MKAFAFVVLLIVSSIGCGKRPAERRTDDPPAVGTPPSMPATVTTVPPVMNGDTPPPASIAAADGVDGAAGAAAAAGVAAGIDPDHTAGAPPATALPAGFADLTKATRIEVMDEWNGYGPITHHLVARLERKGASFDVVAKVASSSNTFSETTPDPYSPRWKYASTCACAIDATCTCERGAIAKKSTVPAAAVEAFLATIASRPLDPKQDYRNGNIHTDDYPRGHAAVWVAGTPDPIHVSFLDNQRHWRVNGAFLSSDPKKSHEEITAAWDRMLKAMGSDPWIKEANAARSTRRR